MTPEEVLDYEYGRELRRMREDGLVMEIVGTSGESHWRPTLKGLRQFGSENLMRITFAELDSTC